MDRAVPGREAGDKYLYTKSAGSQTTSKGWHGSGGHVVYDQMLADRGHIFPHLDPVGQYEQFKRRIERFQYVLNSSSRKLFVHIL